MPGITVFNLLPVSGPLDQPAKAWQDLAKAAAKVPIEVKNERDDAGLLMLIMLSLSFAPLSGSWLVGFPV